MSGLTGESSASLHALLAPARLVALDVDGVLTDGRVVYQGEQELQAFDVRDGLGIQLLAREGLTVAWISGRGCVATRRRAAELGVRELHLETKSKGAALEELQRRMGISVRETVAMGDDLPDLELAARSGAFAVPADAHPEGRRRAHLVCAAAGGRGAVRELAEAILRARGSWQGLVDAPGG